VSTLEPAVDEIVESPARKRLPIPAFVFLVWMTVTSLKGLKEGIDRVLRGDSLGGVLALAFALILASGIGLLVLRHRAARRYWIGVLGSVAALGAVGVLAPDVDHTIAGMTLLAMSGWLLYFIRSRRLVDSLAADSSQPQ
jgi:hypothetical protein